MKRIKLVAPHLTQSHERSAATHEECDQDLVNDTPMCSQLFILRHVETTIMALNWNMQKVRENYFKVLESEMKHELKLNLSDSSATFDHSMENDGIFSC